LSIDSELPKLDVNDADPMLTDWWSLASLDSQGETGSSRKAVCADCAPVEYTGKRILFGGSHVMVKDGGDSLAPADSRCSSATWFITAEARAPVRIPGHVNKHSGKL